MGASYEEIVTSKLDFSVQVLDLRSQSQPEEIHAAHIHKDTYRCTIVTFTHFYNYYTLLKLLHTIITSSHF